MLDNYLQLIESILDERHYFKVKSTLLNQYRHSYAENVSYVLNKIKPKQQRDLQNNKLRFRQVFDENGEKHFIRAACEITVVSYFARYFPDSFDYEPTLNAYNNRNVECQIKLLDYKINIEVKCPDFTKLEAQNLGNHFQLNQPTRADRSFTDTIYPGENGEHIIPHRLDNTLGAFLKDTADKTADATGLKDVNILVVCGNDADNLQQFFDYLYAPGGFFTNNPNSVILEKNEYQNVDAVILCNLYYRHRHYYNKPTIIANWDFAKAFNLVFVNPNRRDVDAKIDIINYIRTYVIPNHTVRLNTFLNGGGMAKMIGQPLEQSFLNAMVIRYYVFKSANEGVNYF